VGGGWGAASRASDQRPATSSSNVQTQQADHSGSVLQTLCCGQSGWLVAADQRCVAPVDIAAPKPRHRIADRRPWPVYGRSSFICALSPMRVDDGEGVSRRRCRSMSGRFPGGPEPIWCNTIPLPLSSTPSQFTEVLKTIGEPWVLVVIVLCFCSWAIFAPYLPAVAVPLA